MWGALRACGEHAVFSIWLDLHNSGFSSAEKPRISGRLVVNELGQRFKACSPRTSVRPKVDVLSWRTGLSLSDWCSYSSREMVGETIERTQWMQKSGAATAKGLEQTRIVGTYLRSTSRV